MHGALSTLAHAITKGTVGPANARSARTLIERAASLARIATTEKTYHLPDPSQIVSQRFILGR